MNNVQHPKKQQSTDHVSLSDQELFQLCRQYGTAALKARRKFEGLLPEVYERKLYEKKEFGSIFEFAAKLAGMTKKQTQRALQIDEKLMDKPVLRETFRSGTVSMNKLSKVAYIATPATDEFWANKVQILSTRAVETLVRDERALQQEAIREISDNENNNGLFETKNSSKSVHVNTYTRSEANSCFTGSQIEHFQLNEDIKNQLSELHQKGIDVNELLREFLRKREQEIAKEKTEFAEKEHIKTEKRKQQNKKPTRYVSVHIKRVLRKEHGSKCSLQNCNKPAENIHHTQRFALAETHDPRYMAPLCKQHHEIAHAIDQKVQKKKWRYREISNKSIKVTKT